MIESTHAPLRLAIVGHTNTGKTSLIRTLLRSQQFGSIKDAAGTTRHVEAAIIMADQLPVLELFDTPGLEDSIALLQELQSKNTPVTMSSRERLQYFVAHKEHHSDFDQEIKVIQQTLSSDILFYVIDVREPVLGKYQDEISILSMAARPIIPVFNFTAAKPENIELWRNAMAQFNLHAVIAFDTVAFDFDAERKLYQKLQSVAETHYDSIQQLINFKHSHWLSLQQAASWQVAQLLIDIGCYRHANSNNEDQYAIVTKIQHYVRAAERNCLQTIFTIFEFSAEDLQHHPLPVSNGNWNTDLFDPQTLKEFGLDAGSAAVKGALVGAGIDLMVAGMSLGAASLIGAVVGASLSTAKRYGKDWIAKLKGVRWYCVDDQTIALLLLRQLHLLRTLLQRGHAAQDRISLNQNTVFEIPSDWPKKLRTLRSHPDWSSQNSSAQIDTNQQLFSKQLRDWILIQIKNAP